MYVCIVRAIIWLLYVESGDEKNYGENVENV